MLKNIFRSLLLTGIFALILCGAYPLVVYTVGNLLFHDAATGGLIERDGKVVGAKLIGQGFSKPEYFHGRPSSAGDKGYDAAGSSGSNLGPTNQKLYDAVKANVDAYLKDNPTVKKGEVPVDAVTASASGLDPHISAENALMQVERVAQARKTSVTKIQEMIQSHAEAPQLGLFGERVVNVLLLNLELDQKMPLASK